MRVLLLFVFLVSSLYAEVTITKPDAALDSTAIDFSSPGTLIGHDDLGQYTAWYRIQIAPGTSVASNSTIWKNVEIGGAAEFNVGGSDTEQITTVVSAGSGSYTVPANCSSIKVECWGSGGGGGSRYAGGGGAYARIDSISVVPGQTYSYSVGSGGGGTGLTFSVAGEDSVFGENIVVADGAWVSSSVGKGGVTSACIGTVKYNGADGADGLSGAVGGGAAGNAGDASGSTGGTLGGGNGGAGGEFYTSGDFPGGGGGAGGIGVLLPNVGAAGADGKIIITATISAVVNTSANTYTVKLDNYTNTLSNNNPVIHLKLNETSGVTATDSGINSLNGTMQSNSMWTDGKILGGSTLNGTNNNITVNDSDYLSSVSICIAVWLNPTSLNGAIMVKANEYSVYIQNGFVHLDVYGGVNVYRSFVATSSVALNQWTHICVMYDNTGFVSPTNTAAKIYYNGSVQDVNMQSYGSWSAMQNSSSDLLIGSSN